MIAAAAATSGILGDDETDEGTPPCALSSHCWVNLCNKTTQVTCIFLSGLHHRQLCRTGQTRWRARARNQSAKYVTSSAETWDGTKLPLHSTQCPAPRPVPIPDNNCWPLRKAVRNPQSSNRSATYIIATLIQSCGTLKCMQQHYAMVQMVQLPAELHATDSR